MPGGVSLEVMNHDTRFQGLTPCERLRLATASFLEFERGYTLVEGHSGSRPAPQSQGGEMEEVMREPLDKMVDSVQPQRRPSIATRVETFLRQESQQHSTSWLVVAILLLLLFGALVIYGVA